MQKVLRKYSWFKTCPFIQTTCWCISTSWPSKLWWNTSHQNNSSPRQNYATLATVTLSFRNTVVQCTTKIVDFFVLEDLVPSVHHTVATDRRTLSSWRYIDPRQEGLYKAVMGLDLGTTHGHGLLIGLDPRLSTDHLQQKQTVKRSGVSMF